MEFRNKCSQHELSTAEVKIGQLLVPVASSPRTPSQPHRAECQTLSYPAWNPAARLCLLHWGLISHREAVADWMEAHASQQMSGCQQWERNQAWRRQHLQSFLPPPLPTAPQAPPSPVPPRPGLPADLATRTGQVMRIKPSVICISPTQGRKLTPQ